MSALDPDYSKRDCSLPPGCKDLIDVLRLETAHDQKISGFIIGAPSAATLDSHAHKQPIQIPSLITVRRLAELLGRKPFELVADLIELKVMANANQSITFEIAAKVVAKYGFLAERDA